MKILPYKGLSYDDICLVPRHSDITSRSEVDIHSGIYSSPIIMSPMIHTSTKEMLRYFMENNMCCTIHRYFDTVEDQWNFYKDVINFKGETDYDVYNPDDMIKPSIHHWLRSVPFFAVGTVNKWKQWIDYLLDKDVKYFCVDVAHGDSTHCVETVQYIKSNSNDGTIVMAGNVAMMDGFAELEQAGADYIRVGISSGQCCSTYNNTGVGTPIVTSLIECHKVRRKAKIIADGGIKYPGDIAKAMAIGADFVMIGGLLAGTSLAHGPFYDKNKEITEFDPLFPAMFKPVYAEYAGMASTLARKYTKSQSTDVSVEGVSGLVAYYGETSTYLSGIHMNLRAALCYLGSRNWEQFNDRAKIMEISTASRTEKDTHLL